MLAISASECLPWVQQLLHPSYYFIFSKFSWIFSKTTRAAGLPSWKRWGLARKQTEQRFAIIIKKIPLTARGNRPFLIIQRSEGLPTSDAAQVRHRYVFCVLLYPFWMRVVYKAPSVGMQVTEDCWGGSGLKRAWGSSLPWGSRAMFGGSAPWLRLLCVQHAQLTPYSFSLMSPSEPNFFLWGHHTVKWGSLPSILCCGHICFR